ncbi:ferrous iron transport protein A [Pleurocapsales cyanobacterium LEGE 10410]|nr:ferrous iron transport protein A [Pleurocapsales cyanobacterium LEGE 10410]
MTYAIDLPGRSFQANKQFQKFIFIGNTAIKSSSLPTRQLQLTPNSNFLDQIDVGSSLLIIEIHTPRNIINQLRNLDFKPGNTVQLVSKTANGSVVISSKQGLLGMGAEIAQRIIVTLVDRAK